MKSRCSSPPCILAFSLVASAVSLAAAYISQYGFGLMPCHLCILQRIPFAVVILLAFAGIGKKAWRTPIILLIALVFLINSGIASYHAAVEKHWVSGPSSCTSESTPAGQSMDDFLARIKNAPVVACDQPQWEFHGVTMAAMNAVWCLFLSLATFAALQKSRRKELPHA